MKPFRKDTMLLDVIFAFIIRNKNKTCNQYTIEAIMIVRFVYCESQLISLITYFL